MALFCSGSNAVSEEPDVVTEKNMPFLLIKFLTLPAHWCVESQEIITKTQKNFGD